MRRIGVAAALALAGCSEPRDWAFVEEDDLRLELPLAPSSAQGQVRAVVEDSTRDLDRALGESLSVFVDVSEFIDQRRETRRRGDWRIFGPFDDPSGRDLSWQVEFTGDDEESRFAFDVGGGVGSAPSLRVFEGEVGDDGVVRRGTVVVDLGALSMLPELRSDPAETFSGLAEVDFVSDGGSRSLQMQLDGFSSRRVGETTWTSSGPVTYEDTGDGSGTVSVDVVRSSDDPLAQSTAVRRFEMSLQWRADARRHVKAVAAAQQPQDTPAPALGELVVDECFGVDGQLVYADVSEPYRDLLVDYVRGDRQQCAFSDEELGRT